MYDEVWCVVSEGDVFKLGGCCINGGDNSDFSLSTAAVVEVATDVVDDVVVVHILGGGGGYNRGDDNGCCNSSSVIVTAVADVVVIVVLDCDFFNVGVMQPRRRPLMMQFHLCSCNCSCSCLHRACCSRISFIYIGVMITHGGLTQPRRRPRPL